MRIVMLICIALTAVAFSQPGEVVVYYSNADNSWVRDALGNLGWPYAAYDASQESDFRTDVQNGADIVVFNCPSNYEAVSLDVLDAYVSGGGRLIMSFWAFDAHTSHNLFAQMEVGYISNYIAPLDLYFWDDMHDIFNVPNSLSEPMTFSDTWAIDGQRIEALGGAMPVAGYTTDPQAGECGIVISSSGYTIYNGFCIDEGDVNMVDFMENQLVFVWEYAALENATWGGIKAAF